MACESYLFDLTVLIKVCELERVLLLTTEIGNNAIVQF